MLGGLGAQDCLQNVPEKQSNPRQNSLQPQSAYLVISVGQYLQCRCTGSSKQKHFVHWAQALSVFCLLLNPLCMLIFAIKSSTAPGWMLLSSYGNSPPPHLLLLFPLQRALTTASLSLCRWHCSSKMATCRNSCPYMLMSPSSAL